jgi:simple sugar transport system substrate-binding protein
MPKTTAARNPASLTRLAIAALTIPSRASAALAAGSARSTTRPSGPAGRAGRKRLAAMAAIACVAAIAGCTTNSGSSASSGGSSSASAAAGTSSGKQLHFIAVMEGPTSSPYWALMNKGFQTASKQLGVTTTYTGVPADDSTPLAERQLILAALARHPDGIMADDDQSAAFNPAIKQVTSAGTPVLLMDVGSTYVSADKALSFVGPNDVEEAAIAGRQLTAMGCKTVLEVTLLPGVATFSDDRAKGFSEGFHGTIIKTQIPISDIDNASAIQGIVKADLLKNSSIDCTFSVGQLFAVPMVSAKAALGSRGASMKSGTLDVDGEILNEIKAGTLGFTVDSQPFSEGYLAVVAMTNYLRFGQAPPTNIGTGPALINSSNVNQMIALDKQGVQ